MLGAGGVDENHVPCYNNSALHLLQLPGHAPTQLNAGAGLTNYTSNGNASKHNGAIKRVREENPVCRQQKFHISSNKNDSPNKVGHITTLINPCPVLTGRGMFCKEEERISSLSSANKNMKNVIPSVLSLSDSLKMEIVQQTEEFGRYIKLKEDNILKGLKELNQRHTLSLLNALEKKVNTKLREKEFEIENINQKNKELGNRIKQVSMEAQSWHHRAKYNESVVTVLKSNIPQLMAKGTAQAQEGSGDCGVDDAVLSTNHPGISIQNCRLKCKSCMGKEVSFLLLPCRHLCLCTDCEGLSDICPICQVVKNASVQVYM